MTAALMHKNKDNCLAKPGVLVLQGFLFFLHYIFQQLVAVSAVQSICLIEKAVTLLVLRKAFVSLHRPTFIIQ